MANEGISAALKLDPQILKDLDSAQKTIQAMRTAAEGLAKGFQDMGAAVTNLAKGIKGTGVSFESMFDKSGTLRSLKIASDAIQQTARTTTSVVKTEAQKQADEAEKAAKRAAAAEQRRQETMKRSASYLNTEAQNAMAINPKGLEQMKEQLRQLTSLQRRFNSQVIKGNPYVDPAMVGRINSAITSLKSNIAGVEQRISSLNNKLTVTSKNASMVRSMLMTAFNPLLVSRFLQQMITVRGEFELAQRSLAVIIRDEGKARDMFNQITQIAIKSPFSVSDLLKQTKQLAAYRIEADKLIDTTKMLGDISAGVGVDMNRLILAYGQVKAAEFLKGTELRQFSEAGVNMLGGLADRFSELYGRMVSVGEVMQMVSKRMVKFSDVEAVLKEATQAGGTFYKMQEKQADTLRGRIVNLGDRIQIMFNEIGKSYDGLMAGIISKLENMVSNWKAVSNILVPLLGGKLISGTFGIIGQTTLFKTISQYTTDASAKMLALNGALTKSNQAAIALRGTLKGVGAVISANWVTIVAALAVALIQAYRNATQLERELKKIVEDFDKTTDRQVDRYNDLLDVAMDVTKTERERQEALDAMKAEYGNILDIQKVELENVHLLNDARKEHIELIRQQAYEEARANAEGALVSDLGTTRQRRLNRMSTDIDALLNQYKKQIKGLQDLSDKEIRDAMVNAENMLRRGTISTTQEARDEFLKMILKVSDATQDEINEVLGSLADGTYPEMQRAFDEVIKGMEKIDAKFGQATTNFDIGRNAQKYRDAIKEIANIDAEFQKNLSNEDKLFYKQNPAQQRLDVLRRIQMYADLMHSVIGGESIDDKTRYLIKADLGEIGEQIIKSIDSGVFEGVGEEAQKVLNKELESALRGVAPEADTDIWMLRLMSKLNKEFSTLKRPFQGGMVRWENGQDEVKFLKVINAELEEVEEMQNKLKNGNEREVLGVIKAFGDPSLKTAEERIQSAKIALMEYYDALKRLQEEGGFVGKMTATEIKARATAIKELARDVIELANGWWLLSKEEQDSELDKARSRALDLKIEPPSVINIEEIRTWLKDTVEKELAPAANFDLKIALDKEADREIKDASREMSVIFDEALDLYKKMAKDKIPQELGEEIRSEIKKRIAEFNKNPNVAPIELPTILNLDTLQKWIEENRGNFLTPDFIESALKLTSEKNTENNDRNNRANQYKQDLKAFLTELKKARKEMDKLDDEEDKLFVQKLQHQGNKVGVKIADDFVPTKEVLDDIINKYLPKLDKADQIDLRLTWSKEDTADTIKGLSDAVNRLWDQYDNAKKMEEWGLVPKEGDTKVTMHRIMALEQELRDKNTEESIKAADEIKKKRLEIARSEQEEIAKLMYDTQKKSLTKIETVYKEMYDNIAKFRFWKNADERDAAINDQIAKSMRELADAEWDAYKSTEAYALAFGDLEGLSRDVLKTLHGDLKAWLEQPDGALQPSEVQTIVKAMQKMEELMNVEKVSSYFDAVKKGFQSIGDAKSAFRDMEEIQERLRPLLAAREEAYQKMMSLAEKAGQAATQENIDAAADAKAEYEDLVELINALVAALNRAKASYKASLDNASKYVDDANDAFNTMRQTIEGAIDLVVEIGEAFGATFSDETNAAIEGFKDGFSIMGNALGLVASVLVTAKLAAMALETTLAGLMSMVWPYLAAAAVIGTIIAVIKARDAALQKQVEEHKDNVERLEKEYDKLEKAIESALNITKLRQTYAEMNANLAKQRQEIQEAIDANNKRKQNDERRKETEELQNQLDEIDEKVEDTRDKWLEMLGAPTDYQSVARDWADSWLDAFKETGSGLDALRESFDELYDDLVVGQLWSQIMAPQIENLQKMVKDALADGDLTEAEAAAIRAFKNTLAFTSGEMEERAKALGIAGGSLSGNTLQRGVESVTEQTAQALESILNATRYDVSDTNVRVANIEAVLAGEGENTILAHLRSQTRYLADIARIASAVYYPGGHSKGTGALKVIADIA